MLYYISYLFSKRTLVVLCLIAKIGMSLTLTEKLNNSITTQVLVLTRKKKTNKQGERYLFTAFDFFGSPLLF